MRNHLFTETFNKRRRRIIIDFFYVLLVFIAIININDILQKKNLYCNSLYPVTTSFEGFYDVPENEVDVLFFGSSVVVNGIIPQLLYDDYKLKTYVLGSQQQSIITSYYWMREALKSQKPKAIVLETRYLYEDTGEEFYRLATDPMRLSINKFEYVRKICEKEKEQSFVGYFLKNIRYSGRWKDLRAEDFRSEVIKDTSLLGFGPFPYIETTEFEPFVSKNKYDRTEISLDKLEYLNKISELCKENGIKLILYTTPRDMTDGIHNELEEYANNHNAFYWDLNEKKYFNQLGVQEGETVINHCNPQGAMRLSKLIGKMIDENINIKKSKSAYWDDKDIAYKQLLNDLKLINITDFDEYLRALDSWDYSVFMSINDEGTRALSVEDMELMQKIGVQTNLMNCFRKSYCFVKGNTGVFEEASDQAISKSISFNDRGKIVKIKSAGFIAGGTTANIIINDEDYSVNSRGINIVVYDNKLGRFVDSVCFDTFESRTAIRKEIKW
ncbi:hypothetical protein [Butyrivibrio sp. NC3005]|uniref:hypothetical protein n=1 Tax=Butyrivibrio sp. NC3005 TaxID=1280685 RepID=UPI00047C2FF4|nr:hypothetical protein [Butyrivibrio sp. NC3005]